MKNYNKLIIAWSTFVALLIVSGKLLLNIREALSLKGLLAETTPYLAVIFLILAATGIYEDLHAEYSDANFKLSYLYAVVVLGGSTYFALYPPKAWLIGILASSFGILVFVTFAFSFVYDAKGVDRNDWPVLEKAFFKFRITKSIVAIIVLALAGFIGFYTNGVIFGAVLVSAAIVVLSFILNIAYTNATD